MAQTQRVTREEVFISLLEALQGGRAPRSAVAASQWLDYNMTILHNKKDGTDRKSGSSDAKCDGRDGKTTRKKEKGPGQRGEELHVSTSLTITSSTGFESWCVQWSELDWIEGGTR